MKVKDKNELNSLYKEYKQLEDLFKKIHALLKDNNIKPDEEIKKLHAFIKNALAAISKKLKEENNRLQLGENLPKENDDTENEEEEAETHDEMTIPVKKGVGLTISTDEEGKMSFGASLEKGDNTIGLDVSSEGDITASAEHEFKNDVTASAEITKESIQLALEKKWEMRELNYWRYLLPPSPATLGLGVVLSVSLNGSIGLEAKGAVNYKKGTASIAINTNGSLTGSVKISGEALGIVEAGGRTALTAAIKGTGDLIFNGSDISPNATISADLVLSINIVIGFSEAIIEIAKEIDIERDDLTFEYPISSLELLRLVGISIKNGSIVGSLSFEPGKDLETAMNTIESGVKKLKEIGDKVLQWLEEAVQWLEDTAKDVGKFIENNYDEFCESLDSAYEFISDLFESEEEKRAEMIKILNASYLQSLISASITKIQKNKKHLIAIKGKNQIQRSLYLISVIIPEILNDPFIRQSLEALKNKDTAKLGENNRIAMTAFSIEKVFVEGRQGEDGLYMGQDLIVHVDVRREEQLWEKILEAKDIHSMVTATLLCDGKVVNSGYIKNTAIISKSMPVSSAITVPIRLPAAAEGFIDSTGAEWSVFAKIDFVGEIMDIESPKQSIKVTRNEEQFESLMPIMQSLLPTARTALYGKKQDGMFIQGQNLTVFVEVDIEELPDPGYLDGIVDVRLFCDKNEVAIEKNNPIRVIAPKSNIRVNIMIPLEYPESLMGGDWYVLTEIKIANMNVIKKKRNLAVLNPNRNFTAPEQHQSLDTSEVDL